MRSGSPFHPYVLLIMSLSLTAGCNRDVALRNLVMEPQSYIESARNGNVCAVEAIELDQYLETNKACRSSDECIVQFIGVCPFRCYEALRADGAIAAHDVLKQFERRCPGCSYECNETQYSAVCIDNRCELRSPL